MEVKELESKAFWTIDDFCQYTGYRKSYVYKLTHQRAIPFVKPRAGRVFFKSCDVIEWLNSGHVMSATEIALSASAYNIRHGRLFNN